MGKVTLDKSVAGHLFWSSIYFFALEYLYVKIQTTIFAYVGYEYEWNLTRYIIGLIIYFIGTYVFFMRKEQVSSLFIYVIYYLSIAPFIVMYQYDTMVLLWMVVYQFVMLLLIKVFLAAFRHKEKHIITQNTAIFNLNTNAYRLLFAMATVFFVYMLAMKGLPSLSNLLFENISDVRGESSFSTLQSIIQNLFCKAVIPMMIAILFDKKKWFGVAYLTIIQVYVYAVTGFKTFLFIPFLMIGFRYLRKISVNKLIIKGLTLALIGCYVIYLLTDYVMILALITNRVFFLPAIIKYAYFDFFSSNDFLYFSESTIGQILGLKSGYSRNIVYIIGQKYFGKPNMWTNTGFLADAYAQMGYLGGILISIITTIELVWIDKVTRYSNLAPGSAMFLLFFISLNDGGLISVSVSGGLLVAIMAVYLINNKASNHQYN